jgi:TPR repeat protein
MRRSTAKSISLLAVFAIGGLSIAQDAATRLPRNKAEVVALLEKANAGDLPNQHIAGLMYLNGSAVPKELSSALKWFRKAADRGYANAQYDLAVMYEEGEGVPASCADAAKWYARAAQQDHVYAIENLLSIYNRGTCLKQDDAEVVRLTRRLAGIGSPDHQLNLGSLYAMGRGVPKDEAEAGRWFALAAEQGQPVAQFMLGQWYRDGRGGITQNYVAAYKWFTLAVAGGNQVDGRNFLGPKMAPEEIGEAKKQAEEWTRNHTPLGRRGHD